MTTYNQRQSSLTTRQIKKKKEPITPPREQKIKEKSYSMTRVLTLPSLIILMFCATRKRERKKIIALKNFRVLTRVLTIVFSLHVTN
jgi:hypothetical protein